MQLKCSARARVHVAYAVIINTQRAERSHRPFWMVASNQRKLIPNIEDQIKKLWKRKIFCSQHCAPCWPHEPFYQGLVARVCSGTGLPSFVFRIQMGPALEKLSNFILRFPLHGDENLAKNQKKKNLKADNILCAALMKLIFLHTPCQTYEY